MLHIKWRFLQLFAGEGAGDGGAAAAATGENASAPDAGEQRLRELGVPEHLLAKRAKREAARKLPQGAVKTAEAPAQPEQEPREQAATADKESPTEEPKPTEAPKRLSWDEIMADPEYNKQMQATVKSRLREARDAQEAMQKLTPGLEVLARRYGQDPAKPDYEALAKSISEDGDFYEEKALEMGVSVETAMKLDRQERDAARQQREQQQTLERQKFQQHIASLEQQGQALKQVFPSFDLRTELQNPAFARMTSPNVGLSVEDAYYAVHRKEIQAAAMQVTAQKTAQRLSNAIQANAQRPTESGTGGQAPSVTTFDYSKASKEQREALKRHIRSEAAHGRKVYPGGR